MLANIFDARTWKAIVLYWEVHEAGLPLAGYLLVAMQGSHDPSYTATYSRVLAPKDQLYSSCVAFAEMHYLESSRGY